MTSTLSGGSLHERLRRQIMQQIAGGRWRPGERIPPERSLATTYGVSLITVRRALRDLALEGVVVRRVPAGTFVVDRPAKPRIIGVAAGGTRSVDSPFFGPMLAGIQAAAPERAEIRLFACPENTPPVEWLKRVAQSGEVEGVIVVTGDPLTYEDIAPLDLRGFPYVLLNRRIPDHAVWCVVLNDYDVGREAVEYLYALGHREIAHVAGPPELVTSADRVRGFIDGLDAHGLLGSSSEAPVVHGRFSYGVEDAHESGYAATRTLLTRVPPPTAIFASSDDLAIGAYRALREAGRRVGDDVSVIGMVNSTYAASLDPPLTSFDYRRTELGRQAVQLLMDQLDARVDGGNGTDPARRMRVVKAHLIERASCREALSLTAAGRE
jgi:DNA-binding LacI/PurR family transcriptional regulator